MKRTLVMLTLLIAAVGVSAGLWLHRSKTPPPPSGNFALAFLQSDDAAGFAPVDPERRLLFPDDHGAHPETRTETWYFTALVETEQGRRFGVQLMFFRLALAPKPPQSTSAWTTNQIYRAHFALTDAAGQRFYSAERFSRAALGLSGAQTGPVRVWLENWSAELTSTDPERPGFRLRAADGDSALELELAAVKPLVFPDARSLATAGAAPAFRFYLASRLQARGILNIAGETFTVRGQAWLDRAWGLVPMAQGQIALDRFALQLDDGRELLIFQLHRRDGSGVPTHTGLLIGRDGSLFRLGRRDIELTATEQWTSPAGGASYPAHWRLRLPAQNLDLTLTPYVADQEIKASVRYWGGAVAIGGNAGGNGYVELTGYAGKNKT